MSQPTDDQIAKLPKWAREYIEHLEREVLATQANADSITKAHPNTDTFLEGNGPWSDGIQLPKRSRIRFKLGEPRRQEVEVYIKQDYSDMPPYLLVQAYNSMLIRPEATNTIRIIVP